MIYVGTNHSSIAVQELAMTLKRDKLKAWLKSREKELESLFHAASQAISNFDVTTEEYLKLLHRTRDEQVLKPIVILIKCGSSE